MKTSELTGALLDYHVARAEGVPASRLWFTKLSRDAAPICVMAVTGSYGGELAKFYRPSTDWAQGGPLIEKTSGVDAWCRNGVLEDTYWKAPPGYDVLDQSEGDTPLIAICRAVVRAKFGDEVEDIEVTG